MPRPESAVARPATTVEPAAPPPPDPVRGGPDPPALLTWAAASANVGNEHRLLKLQVRQAATALGSAIPSLETPLTAAFDVAAATHDPQQFEQFIAPDVGPAGPFVSASLWRIAPGPPAPLVVVGANTPVGDPRPGGVAVPPGARRRRAQRHRDPARGPAPTGLRRDTAGTGHHGGGLRRDPVCRQAKRPATPVGPPSPTSTSPSTWGTPLTPAPSSRGRARCTGTAPRPPSPSVTPCSP